MRSLTVNLLWNGSGDVHEVSGTRSGSAGNLSLLFRKFSDTHNHARRSVMANVDYFPRTLAHTQNTRARPLLLASSPWDRITTRTWRIADNSQRRARFDSSMFRRERIVGLARKGKSRSGPFWIHTGLKRVQANSKRTSQPV